MYLLSEFIIGSFQLLSEDLRGLLLTNQLFLQIGSQITGSVASMKHSMNSVIYKSPRPH
jgi:hypothetical protein